MHGRDLRLELYSGYSTIWKSAILLGDNEIEWEGLKRDTPPEYESYESTFPGYRGSWFCRRDLANGSKSVAPDDGAYQESRSPMTSSPSIFKVLRPQFWGMAWIHQLTWVPDWGRFGGDSSESGQDFASNEYGLRFSGVIGEATTFSYSPNWRTYSGELR